MNVSFGQGEYPSFKWFKDAIRRSDLLYADCDIAINIIVTTWSLFAVYTLPGP